MLNIRRRHARQIEVIRWQQRFQPDRSITEPQTGERYFQLLMSSDVEQVRVLILIEAWFRFRWPELSSCAWDVLDEAAMVSLFRSEYEGHVFFSGAFRVVSLEVVDGKEVSQSWLTVEEASLGTVLLCTPIAPLNTVAKAPWLIRRIRLQADWVLGSSYISASLLQTLALGDVLCIQHLRLYLSVTDRPVALFQKNQEGVFVIDENIDEMMDETEALSLPDESSLELSPSRFEPTKMTVKLTFVLGSSDIPLAELEHIQPGAVYSIGDNKEREVKVFANKQLIAEGELIYIGDGDELGLEIIRLAGMGCVES